MNDFQTLQISAGHQCPISAYIIKKHAPKYKLHQNGWPTLLMSVSDFLKHAATESFYVSVLMPLWKGDVVKG